MMPNVFLSHFLLYIIIYTFVTEVLLLIIFAYYFYPRVLRRIVNGRGCGASSETSNSTAGTNLDTWIYWSQSISYLSPRLVRLAVFPFNTTHAYMCLWLHNIENYACIYACEMSKFI